MSTAPSVRFASVRADGTPLLRTFSAVVLDGRLCFHGADAGEKREIVGRPAVASAEDLVAQIASYWIHPELACPASTYYRSAIVEGTVEVVRDPAQRARILAALMQRFQPEGGHAPIDPGDRRYQKVLAELFVAELVPTRVSAKYKLGQHRTRRQIEGVLHGLWERGAASDLRAIRLIKEAHPERPEPAFLVAPEGCELCVFPDAEDARKVAALLSNQYWTHTFSSAVMERAQRGSQAWVVARDREGEVIGSARGVSDGARFGWVLDVIVRSDQRGKGIGQALMRLLLAHPALRRLAYIGLRTRDAHGLYQKFGFESQPGAPEQMGLRRVQSE